MQPIYLDNNATTPIDHDVLQAMLPFLREAYGNPSSAYGLGRQARDAIESARAEVATLIGAHADEIVFTGGGTEASNMAIRGAVAIDSNRRAIVTTAIEHPATESCCVLLEAQGHTVCRIASMTDGRVDAAMVADAIDETTAIVSVIHAQNEIGTLQPVDAIADAAHEHGALMHADVAQSLGKIPVNVDALGVDLLSVAGHKLYAPKGVGVLYVRRGVALPSLIVGAGQEHGRRPGTENVAAIVALGAACRIAGERLERDRPRISTLATELHARLAREVPGLVLVGHPTERLPNTLNVLFPGVSGRALLAACPRVMASNGSACHADSEEPSAILTALGISRDAALGAVRLSVGRYTTHDDIEAAATSLAAAWQTLRATNTVAA